MLRAWEPARPSGERIDCRRARSRARPAWSLREGRRWSWRGGFRLGDAEVATRKAVAAFMAMTATVFPLAFIMRNLPRLNVALLVCEFRIFRDLVGALPDRQFRAEQISQRSSTCAPRHRRNPRSGRERSECRQLQRLDPVPAGDENEAPIALDHGRRGSAGRLRRRTGIAQRRRSRRKGALLGGISIWLSRRVRPFADRLIVVIVMRRLIHSAAIAGARVPTTKAGGGRTGLSPFDGCEAARSCANRPAVRPNAAAGLRTSNRRSPTRNASSIRSNAGPSRAEAFDAATAPSSGGRSVSPCCGAPLRDIEVVTVSELGR